MSWVGISDAERGLRSPKPAKWSQDRVLRRSCEPHNVRMDAGGGARGGTAPGFLAPSAERLKRIGGVEREGGKNPSTPNSSHPLVDLLACLLAHLLACFPPAELTRTQLALAQPTYFPFPASSPVCCRPFDEPILGGGNHPRQVHETDSSVSSARHSANLDGYPGSSSFESRAAGLGPGNSEGFRSRILPLRRLPPSPPPSQSPKIISPRRHFPAEAAALTDHSRPLFLPSLLRPSMGPSCPLL